MNKEFIPYTQSLELKELGFDEPCFGLYAPPSKTVFLHHYGLLSAKEQILAPTFSQASRWFREKHGLIGWVEGKTFFMYCIESTIPTDGQLNLSPFKTYEEAELACIVKLIQIVKQKQL